VPLLEKDYPPPLFRYALDTTRLFNGSRIFPDVQVFAPDSDRPVCVVEIGYTRPEKLSYYKELGIPDIRWYGRDSGKLYSYGSVEPITRKVSLQYNFKPSAADVWRSAMLEGSALCIAGLNAFYDLRETLQTISTRYGQLRCAAKTLNRNEILYNHEQFAVSRQDIWTALIAPDLDAYSEVIDGLLHHDVFNEVWSNGYGVIVLNHCDVCGETRVVGESTIDEDVVWDSLENDIKSYESFLYRNRRTIERQIANNCPPEIAKVESHKTTTELIEYFDHCGVEHTPLIFDRALHGAERLKWNRKKESAELKATAEYPMSS